MAAATETTRHVSRACDARQGRAGLSHSREEAPRDRPVHLDASNVLIAAPRPRTERPELLGKAQDSIILAKSWAVKMPSVTGGLHLVDVPSPGEICRRLRNGDSEDEFLACRARGWPDAVLSG